MEVIATTPVLSLIIPTRNERETVGELSRRVAQALNDVEYELLFVDDSDDDTADVISQLMADDPRIAMIHRDGAQRSGGLGTAVLSGMRAARGSIIAVMDGDLQHPPEILPQMLNAARTADIVVASRYIPGGTNDGLDGIGRRVASRSSTALAALAFAPIRTCTDPMSGFFAFNRRVIQGVELRPRGFKILLELLVCGKWTSLIEVPYHFAPREGGRSNASLKQGTDYLRHLVDLRRRAPRRRGHMTYHRLRGDLAPDDPRPLDDELPAPLAPLDSRGRRVFWLVVLAAVTLRLVLLPIGHTWDLTIGYDVFIDLARGHSPYDTIQMLAHVAQSAQWYYAYEYYAYPPVPLYFYYPLAHLFLLLHPQASYFIPVEGTLAAPNLPWDFYALYKLPMWIADFLVATLLARLSGTIRGFRDYLLNPYVLLVSAAWTFDSVMLLGLIAGVYWLQKGHINRAALALAFGTMVKFIPILAVPTCVIFLIKRQRPLGEIVRFLVVYGIACFVMVGPYFSGLLYVLNFHDVRPGGGMNWQMMFQYPILWPSGVNLNALALAAAALGTPTLVIALLLAYWYIFTTDMSFNRMLLITLLAFLIGSKLVNEQYALAVFPFAFIEARQRGGAWKWLFRLLWIIPLAFAIMHVPIDHFIVLLYHTVYGSRADAVAATLLTGFENALTPWKRQLPDSVAVVALGLAFNALCLVAIFWPIKLGRRRLRQRSGGAEATGSLVSAPAQPARDDDSRQPVTVVSGQPNSSAST